MLDISFAFVLAIVAFLPAAFIFKQWERIRTLKQRCDNLASSNVEQHEKVEKLQAELEATKKKATDSALNAKVKEDGWNTSALETLRLKGCLTKMQDDYEQLQMRYARETHANQDRLHTLQTQTEGLKKLLETQAVELTAAREFTFMTDRVSAADVTRTVEDLNSTIYQAAMQLISMIPPDSDDTSKVEDERLIAETRSRSVNAIGEQLLDVAISSAKDDETLSILAFQSGIAHVCSLAISSWAFGMVHESEILKIVYEQIWANEKQAVAGRWRSLTSKQLSGLSDRAIRHEILTVLVCILFSISWKDEPENIRSALETELGDSIDEVVQSVSKTSKMIREEFISDDLQVVCARPGQTFNASSMDVDGDAPNVEGDVLGTVELGLALRSRSGGQSLILKPKVVINTHIS
ncbi:hypothetical protein AX15_002036 [Amanita polypyramis BW_CC]|nr:hypothetical protein AX15_002036 [Amanita polypyramis BW_CC]